MNTQEKIIKIITRVGNSTNPQIREALPDLRKGQVTAALATLVYKGVLDSEDSGIFHASGHGKQLKMYSLAKPAADRIPVTVPETWLTRSWF